MPSRVLLVWRIGRGGWYPHQASPEVEAAVCELRRAHPRWGAWPIEFETHQISAQI
jgi:hypothetical protein